MITKDKFIDLTIIITLKKGLEYLNEANIQLQEKADK